MAAIYSPSTSVKTIDSFKVHPDLKVLVPSQPSGRIKPFPFKNGLYG